VACSINLYPRIGFHHEQIFKPPITTRFMSATLTTSQIAKLKSKAQLLEPVLKIGKEGLSEAFIKSTNHALDSHELVKVKFAAFKEEKKVLSVELAERTSSLLVTRVGNVAVLYRQNPDPSKRKITV
jgi:RNA-binding protein